MSSGKISEKFKDNSDCSTYKNNDEKNRYEEGNKRDEYIKEPGYVKKNEENKPEENKQEEKDTIFNPDINNVKNIIDKQKDTKIDNDLPEHYSAKYE